MTLEYCKCNNSDIPDRLHTNSRKPILDFNSDEKIWRRFSPVDGFNKSNVQVINGNKKPKLSVFSFKSGGMSCNREQFSESANDVLYNVDSSEHFFNYYIYKFVHSDLVNTIIKDLKLETIHKPTPCMYPHIEICCNKYSSDINEIPDTYKTELRQRLQSICEIIKSD